MKKKWLRDGALILILLAAALLLMPVFRPGEAGAAVVVEIAGEEAGRFPLNEERTLRFGEEHYNVLQIAEGRAAVVEANCGDHTCVRTGAVDRAGERIICLPHGLVVRVIGGEESGVDAVVG